MNHVPHSIANYNLPPPNKILDSLLYVASLWKDSIELGSSPYILKDVSTEKFFSKKRV